MGFENSKNESVKCSILLTRDLKHLLWQDEQGHDFLLVKFGEIYEYDKNTLRLLTWSREKRAQIDEMT